MAKIRSILIIFFTLVVYCNCQSENPVASSWAKLQISPDTLSNMEYGNFLIRIYEHANNHRATTTDGQKNYFYQPIALLDNKSAVSKFNRITKQQEVIFFIEMWNNEVQNQVVKHISEVVEHKVDSNKVTIIPVEKVILTSTVPTNGYSLSPVWTDYDKSKTLRLSLSCFDASVCDEMASEMRSNPEQFYHLKLLYSLSSQTSQKREIKIKIDSVTSGDMVTKLLQTFGDKKEIFLTANDEKKMLAETATNIRMETFDDSEVTSVDSESQISNILKDLMVTSRTNIKEQSDKMWDSVFWNEENYRPDKTTKTLNEILDKLDSETQKKLGENFQNAEKKSETIEILKSSAKDEEKKREEQVRREKQSKDVIEKEEKKSWTTEDGQNIRTLTRNDQSSNQREDVDVSGGGFGVTLNAKSGVEKSDTHNTEQEKETNINTKKSSDQQKRNSENKETTQNNFDSNSRADVDRTSSTNSEKTANDFDRSQRMETLQDDVEKFLVESRNHVQWDGEKFVPKPMQLSRINLAKFRDSQSFQDRKVNVRYTIAELSAPIKFMEHAELTVTDEWNNLKDELKVTKELLKNVKIDTEKNIATSNRLTDQLKVAEDNLKKELRNNLEMFETKTTHFSTKSELEISVANLTKNIEAKYSRLTDQYQEVKANLQTTRTDFANTNTKLIDVKSQLTDELQTLLLLVIDLKSELTNELQTKYSWLNNQYQEVKANLQTIRTDFVNTSTKLIDVKKELTNELQTKYSHLTDQYQEVKANLQTTRTDIVAKYSRLTDQYQEVKAAQKPRSFFGFHAQESRDFESGSLISFSQIRLNQGNGFSGSTYTAPVSGIYFFSFSSVVYYGSLQLVNLQKNGNNIGHALGHGNYQTLTLQITVYLSKGDEINVKLVEGKIWNYRENQINFSGWLIQ